MPDEQADQAPIYACPHCDETFPSATPDEHVQIILHRGLHARVQSKRLENPPQGIDSHERTNPVLEHE